MPTHASEYRPLLFLRSYFASFERNVYGLSQKDQSLLLGGWGQGLRIHGVADLLAASAITLTRTPSARASSTPSIWEFG